MTDSSCQPLPFNFYHVLLGLVLGEAIGLMIWVMFGFAYRFTVYNNVYTMPVSQKTPPSLPSGEESKKASV